MPRTTHTITRFKGIDTLHSVMEIMPSSALNCLNVVADESGALEVVRQPVKLATCPGSGSDGIPKSMGVLSIAGQPLRLVIQQPEMLYYTDLPSSPVIFLPYTSTIANPGTARMDWVQANRALYFSNGTVSGKVLPGDSTVYGWGIPQAGSLSVSPSPASSFISTSAYAVTSISRLANVVTVVFGSAIEAGVGAYIMVDPGTVSFPAPWPTSFVGQFIITSVNLGTSTVTYAQVGANDAGPYPRAFYPDGLTPTAGGYLYIVSWGADLAADYTHFGTASDIILNQRTGNFSVLSPAIFGVIESGLGINQAAIFRTLDGGTDFYLLAIVDVPQTGPFAHQIFYIDTTSDDDLVVSGQTPPYDNGVYPGGKYVCPVLDRIVSFGIPGNPTAMLYSGYDSINFGRPQESWPQYNSIKIGEGQAEPNGAGQVRYGGLIVFCNNRRMFILRGTLNDIVISAPVSLSFTMEELPYRIGNYSHFAIQSTPAGLVWLDDGMNLRLYDPSTFYPPKKLSQNLQSYFQRIDPGSQDEVESAYINLLDRDWYIIIVSIAGVRTMFIINVDPDPATNSGCWPTTVPATRMAVVKYPDQTTHMLALMATIPGSPDTPPATGYLTEIVVLTDTANGVQVSSDTPLMPDAFWKSGYFGIRDEQAQDVWQQIKKFRYTQTTAGPAQISVGFDIVDNLDYTFNAPLTGAGILGDIGTTTQFTATIDEKGRAMSITLTPASGPDAAPNPILSLTVAWIPTSVR